MSPGGDEKVGDPNVYSEGTSTCQDEERGRAFSKFDWEFTSGELRIANGGRHGSTKCVLSGPESVQKPLSNTPSPGGTAWPVVKITQTPRSPNDIYAPWCDFVKETEGMTSNDGDLNQNKGNVLESQASLTEIRQWNENTKSILFAEVIASIRWASSRRRYPYHCRGRCPGLEGIRHANLRILAAGSGGFYSIGAR
ncbi:hypothetical protein CC1G_15719 [Coprinopsis cinerea okayama7|uniref:Uncharacterized protein n=1 Tax=Coprinopsis cinerea (strain Okayama-7 / 130 / ATCC MYA-4618 / FGSC 9003) TaxID=240176 RepID=D6RQI0_COPC7|nr:hypothetical protein CC1G_15719 [Coprinopsis cinerea okayama7\|eukprot:XP_002910290.1 hypothetical protein CC1G_15719 [Coprinopsis cinerea okayama7\